MHRAVFLISALLLASCASAPLTPTALPRVGESPPLSQVTERSVGDVIYEIYNYRQLTGARLQDTASADVFLARWTIDSAQFLEAFQTDGRQVYCTAQPVLHVTGSGIVSSVCLVDTNNDGTFDSWNAPDGPPARKTWNKLDAPLPYKRSDSMATTGGGGFRYELLYQGLSSNVVGLLYREYADDLARPAFQQDLNYTLQPIGPTEISFRAIRIRIHSADNNKIRYEVLTGLQKRDA